MSAREELQMHLSQALSRTENAEVQAHLHAALESTEALPPTPLVENADSAFESIESVVEAAVLLRLTVEYPVK